MKTIIKPSKRINDLALGIAYTRAKELNPDASFDQIEEWGMNTYKEDYTEILPLAMVQFLDEEAENLRPKPEIGLKTNTEIVEWIADYVYRKANPEGKMDTPSIIYEQVEKDFEKFLTT